MTALMLPLLTPSQPGRAETLQCLTLRAPCQAIDTIDVMLPAASASGIAPAAALVANFGLLTRDGTGQIRYACEPAIGGLAVRARMAPGGEIFVPGDQGMVRYRPGCAARAVNDLAGHLITGVIFDRTQPQRIWALGIDGPSTLYLSNDGGDRFTQLSVFSPNQPIWQMKSAPSRADTLWGLGERPPQGQLLLVRSDDGGRSFVDVATRAGAQPLAGLPLDLLGIDPENPEIVYVGMRDSDNADAVWRSRDGGLSWQRGLVLPVNEFIGGFTFGPAGAAGRTLYVAGRSQVETAGAAPAHLYASLDGGETWQTPLPSGAAGPRFRCLAHQDNVLYACAGGDSNGDQFLLGSSDDGGKNWKPVITTQQIAGPEACMVDSCAPTTAWLCGTYQLCGGDDAGISDAGAGGDAGSDGDRGTSDGFSDGTSGPAAATGCDCDFGRSITGDGRGSSPRWWWALAALALAGARVVRQRGRRRPVLAPRRPGACGADRDLG